MEAKVEVKMTPKIMYDFMMYHTYRSFSGIFGIILGIAAFVMFGMTLGKTELSYSMIYCLFGVWFIVYHYLRVQDGGRGFFHGGQSAGAYS